MATKRESESAALPPANHRRIYDTLLETFLPVIHKAAHSVTASAHPDTAGDLLLAGLRGLKQALLQLGDANQPIPQKAIEQTIYTSMREQLKSTRLNHDQDRSEI